MSKKKVQDILDEKQKETFKNMYYKTKYTNQELDLLCNELFDINKKDITTINKDTEFMLENFDDKTIYSVSFMNFLNTTNNIFNDDKITNESKYIKIYQSFKNRCYNKNFKAKIKLYLLQLKFICCFNHKILLEKLYDVILKNIKLIGNCDQGMIESNLPIELRNTMSYLKNCVSSDSEIQEVGNSIFGSLFQTASNMSIRAANQDFSKNLISSASNVVCPVKKPELIDLPTISIENLPQDFNQLNYDNVEKHDKSDGHVSVGVDDDLKIDKLRILVMKTREMFSSLVKLYYDNYVSICDLTNSINHEEDISKAIRNYSTKTALKNSFNSELAYWKTVSSAPGAHGHISKIILSLGLGFAPISFGISYIGGAFIDWLIDLVFKSNYVRILDKSAVTIKEFNLSLVKFKNFLYKKEGKYINNSQINECKIGNRNRYKLFYTASLLQEDFIVKTFEYYDKILLKYNNFLYIYNLLCDTTKEQDNEFIETSNLPEDNINLPKTINQQGESKAVSTKKEELVNELFDKLENSKTICLTHDSESRYIPIYRSKTPDEKKQILGLAYDLNTEILPIPKKCTANQISRLFNRFIGKAIDAINADPSLASKQVLPLVSEPPSTLSSVSIPTVTSSPTTVTSTTYTGNFPFDLITESWKGVINYNMDDSAIRYIIYLLEQYFEKNNCKIKSGLNVNDISNIVIAAENKNLEDIEEIVGCVHSGGRRKTRKLRKNKTRKQRKSYRKRLTRRR
jgi:hypothetical protein